MNIERGRCEAGALQLQDLFSLELRGEEEIEECSEKLEWVNRLCRTSREVDGALAKELHVRLWRLWPRNYVDKLTNLHSPRPQQRLKTLNA